jgi:hypothetical protein
MQAIVQGRKFDFLPCLAYYDKHVHRLLLRRGSHSEDGQSGGTLAGRRGLSGAQKDPYAT